MGGCASEEREGSRADVTEGQIRGGYGKGVGLEGLAGMIRDAVRT